MSKGIFVISLDFELLWGMIDHATEKEYGENILGGKKAVSRMLKLFSRYGIHATWACVGMIYYESLQDLRADVPDVKPTYNELAYSTYSHLEQAEKIGAEYFLAPELVEQIKQCSNQEIATHTYSHYYCMEQGQTKEQFKVDIAKAKQVAKSHGNEISTIIFPRNQFNTNYSDVLLDCDIKVYRGNEKEGYCYASHDSKQGFFRRILRLLDAYVNIFGNHCYSLTEIKENGLLNVRSSRFFRPYSKSLACLEYIRLRRIKQQMLYAAQHDKVFHLWWHPHNFGRNAEKNFSNLIEILRYYKQLNEKYGMESMNMQEVGKAYYENFGSSQKRG